MHYSPRLPSLPRPVLNHRPRLNGVLYYIKAVGVPGPGGERGGLRYAGLPYQQYTNAVTCEQRHSRNKNGNPKSRVVSIQTRLFHKKGNNNAVTFRIKLHGSPDGNGTLYSRQTTWRKRTPWSLSPSTSQFMANREAIMVGWALGPRQDWTPISSIAILLCRLNRHSSQYRTCKMELYLDPASQRTAYERSKQIQNGYYPQSGDRVPKREFTGAHVQN